MLVTVDPANTEKALAVPRPTGDSAARASVELNISTAAAVAATDASAASPGRTARRRLGMDVTVIGRPFREYQH